MIKRTNKASNDFELDFESIKTVLIEYFRSDPKFVFVLKDSGNQSIFEIIDEVSLEDLS